MKWISKDPPIYVWLDDEWYNERDKKTYKADRGIQSWYYLGDEHNPSNMIPFPKRTILMPNKQDKLKNISNEQKL